MYPPLLGVSGMALFLGLLGESDSVSQSHQSDIQKRECCEGDQERPEQLRVERGSARLEHDRRRVQPPKQIDAQVNERHQDHRHDADDSRESCPLGGYPDGGSEDLVSEQEEEEKESQRQARVPGPPRAPDRLSPDGTRSEHHGTEDRPDFGRRRGEAVEMLVAQPEIEDAGETGQANRQERTPRRWRMDVEDFLSQSLPDLGRGKSLGEGHHDGQRQEGCQRDAPAASDQDLSPDGIDVHSSTTAEKRSSETVINATS